MGSITEQSIHGPGGTASMADLAYQSGFGNEFATESVAGALPVGRNSPQRAPLGLYAEVLSGTAFTAPRSENSRTWLYKIRPSAMHGPFRRIGNGLVRSGPFAEVETPPNRLRWDPLPMSDAPADFVDGLATMAGSGDPASQAGIAVHVYRATRSMTDRCFVNADGELMLVPQQGELLIFSETGKLHAAPGEICVIPRGMKFKVELPAGPVRGYVCENYGPQFRLPELGPIGSNGLANPRDFLAPVAAWEDNGRTEVVTKFMGGLWSAEWEHSPLDTVAWHGTCTAYKYDLARFMTINTVSFDHCDPSIFTVMTAPSGQPGVANVDFVIFPPRWAVAENTFRPPWFHRNYMSELMGLVHGVYDAKAEGFLPGGISLHNSMTAHGPDVTTFERASAAELQPHKIDGSLAFMFESRYVFRPTQFAMQVPQLQKNYDGVWGGFRKNFDPI